MALKTSKLSTATVLAALLSMMATPVAALDLPQAGPPTVHTYDGDAGNVDRDRRDRDRHHRHGRDGISTGDVLAGVLVLGGLAAIASAASKPRETRTSYPEPRYPDRAPGYAPSGNVGGQGMDRAVGMCVDAVERQEGRIGSVDGANRTGDGWQVSGELAGGQGYSCWIGNDGRVSGVEVYGDDQARSYGDGAYDPANDRQWDDESYARARAAIGSPSPYQTAQTGY
ncbi:MAG TPA: hypothetical protein VNR60_09380 [Croceibacterium sp.]|nr:hypothetical protein [Croceibacterium sp.]